MSPCISLTTDTNDLKLRHTQLETILSLLNQSPTKDLLNQANQLKGQIQKLSSSLEADIKAGLEQILKEKLNLDFNTQLSIYNELGQKDWSDEIQAHKHQLIQRLIGKTKEVQEKIKEGMRPILMPGRETQKKDWEQSLKQLKPYWREKGKPKELNDPYIWTDGYRDILSKPESWSDIPTEPYILWTKPSPTVDSETKSKSVVDQKKLITKKHTQHPNLYDPTDLHPLEYASLQVMYTHQLSQTRESSEDIIPLDKWGNESWTRFVSRGLSSGNVLCGGFRPGNRRLSFYLGGSGADSGGGLRLAGRV